MNYQPWCAMFVSYIANEAGILGNVVPKYASVEAGRQWYIKQGRYSKRSSGYTPKAGDVIFLPAAGKTIQASSPAMTASPKPYTPLKAIRKIGLPGVPISLLTPISWGMAKMAELQKGKRTAAQNRARGIVRGDRKFSSSSNSWKGEIAI